MSVQPFTELQMSPPSHDAGVQAHAPDTGRATPVRDGNPAKNELRVIRGIETKVTVDANGNKVIETEKTSVNPSEVTKSYDNFWNNFLQQQISYREKYPERYDAIMAAQFEPRVLDRIQRMMEEVPDEHGAAKKWKINSEELHKFLQTKQGLALTTSLVEDQMILEAAAMAKEQKNGFNPAAMRWGYRLAAAEKMWDFASQQQNADYLREIWGIDVQDVNRPTSLIEQIKNPAQFFRANQVKETLGGAAALRESLKAAYDTRGIYYRDVLGYKGKLQASPAQFLIDYLYSNGKATPEELDTEFNKQFLRQYEPNLWGIQDRNHNTPESRRGVRNPNFDRRNLDDAGNIDRFFEARRKVQGEIAADLLSQEKLDRDAHELQEKKHAVEVRAAMEPNDPSFVKRREAAEAEKEKLGKEIAEISSRDADFIEYRDKTEAMNNITHALRVENGLTTIADGMQKTDVVNAVAAEDVRLQTNFDASKAALDAALTTNVDAANASLNTDIHTATIRLNTDIYTLNTTLRGTIDGLRTTLATNIDAENTTLQGAIDGINTALADTRVRSRGARTILGEIQGEIQAEKNRILSATPGLRSSRDEARAEAAATAAIDAARPGQRLRAEQEIKRQEARIKSLTDAAEARIKLLRDDHEAHVKQLQDNNAAEVKKLRDDNAAEVAKLRADNAAHVKKLQDDNAAEVQRLDSERIDRMEKLKQLRDEYVQLVGDRSKVEERLISGMPRGELVKMREAYDSIVTIGSISPADISNRTVEDLVKSIKRQAGTGTFVHIPRNTKLDQIRELVIRAKAEQAALDEQRYITSPADHLANFTAITTGVHRGGGGTVANPITDDELVYLDENTLRLRLENEYGWDPADELNNWQKRAKARVEARQRLAIRSKTLADVTKANLEERKKQVEEKASKDGPKKEAIRKNEILKATDMLCDEQDHMMTESRHVIEAIDEYTDVRPIDPADQTYSDAEKKLNAPRGYIKMLEYFGYDRNKSSMKDRNDQLQLMQRVIDPAELANRIYETLPQLHARVAAGSARDISVVLTGMRDAVRAGDVHDDDLRTATRAMLREMLDVALQIE
jgi:hypothetical protein